MGGGDAKVQFGAGGTFFVHGFRSPRVFSIVKLEIE
jgi:hypothetical protein